MSSGTRISLSCLTRISVAFLSIVFILSSRSVFCLDSSGDHRQQQQQQPKNSNTTGEIFENDFSVLLKHWPNLSWTTSVDLFNTPVRIGHSFSSSSLNSNSSFNSNSSSSCFLDLLSILTAVRSSHSHSHSIPDWLLSLLDSLGKIPSGIQKGAVNWPGDFKQCLEVKRMANDEKDAVTKDAASKVRFSGRYCSVYWSVNLPNGSMIVPVTQGICVPDSCQTDDMQVHLKTILSLIELDPKIRRFLEHNVKFTGVYCHPLPEERPWNSVAVFTLTLMAATAFIAIFATIFEWFVYWRSRTLSLKRNRLRRTTSSSTNRKWRCQSKGRFPPHPEDEECIVRDDSSGEEVASSDSTHDSPPAASSSSPSDPSTVNEDVCERNKNPSVGFQGRRKRRSRETRQVDSFMDEEDFFCIPLKLLFCFSLLSNTRKLLNTNSEDDKRSKNSRPQIPCLNGIRVLSMTWVILCHSYLFSLSVTNNLVDLLEDAKNSAAFSIVINGSFSVDSFFVLSAFLLAYNFLIPSSRNRTRSEGSTSSIEDVSDEERTLFRSNSIWSRICFLPSMYLYRILRLLPVYIIVLLIDSSVAHLTSSGPFWDYGDQVTSEHTLCHDSWWYNVLFINNFLPLKDQCMAWTWYLANDMQFFLVAPLFLFVVKWNRNIGLVLLKATLISVTIATFVISYRNKINTGFPVLSQNPDPNALTSYVDMLYTKPHARAGPYLIGLMAGVILSDNNLSHLRKIRSTTKFSLYIVAATLLGLTIFGPYHAVFTDVGAAFFNSMSRLAWGLMVSLLIFLTIEEEVEESDTPLATAKPSFLNPIGSILSWTPFTPMSRLVYSAYLIHPIVINYFYRSLQQPIEYTLPGMIVFYAGAVSCVFISSIPFYLLFEVPVLNIQRVIKSSRASNF